MKVVAVTKRRVVARQEERPAGDLLGLAEAAHRHVDQALARLLGVLGEQLLEQRRVHGPGAERVHAHAAVGELHPKLARERQHAALRGGVGDLRHRGAHDGDEGGDVDNGPAARLEQVRDAVLAAQEDRPQVHVLDPLPGLERGLDRRGVVVGIDARVVHQDVDAAELLSRARVHLTHLVLVGHVDLHPDLAHLRLVQVGGHDARALGLEHPRGLGPDAAGGAGDHAHLAVEPSHQGSVAM